MKDDIKAKDIYFNLRYKEKITGYERLSNFENKSVEEIKDKYSKNGGINQYFIDKIKEKHINFSNNDLKDIVEEFEEYHNYHKKYYNPEREFFFENYEVLLNWFKEQKNLCGYCGVSQDELNEIVVIRNSNLTLNQKKKRKNGTLEIEQKTPINSNNGKAYSDLNNLILACPLCNNAKSNLIDEESWRNIFVDPMRSYYEKILEKRLRNPKPKSY